MTKARIYYARVDELWRKGEKYAYLEEKEHVGNVAWQELEPDAKGNWLTEGMRDEFETFVPLVSKEAKAAKITTDGIVFKTYSNGVKTNRDTWAYNFDPDNLFDNIKRTINVYNQHVYKLEALKEKSQDIDALVNYDDANISWSSTLKIFLKRRLLATADIKTIREAHYRPFCSQYLYYDDLLNDRPGLFASIFPNLSAEEENRVICATGVGAERPFASLISNSIPDLNFFGPGTVPQWFPFYTYDEDGTNRRENITDWALEKFRAQYGYSAITKWDIFHYVYAVLHHPLYRERYAANLKRELPRVPLVGTDDDVVVGVGLVPTRPTPAKTRAGTSPAPTDIFHAFARAGARLAEIHVNYEQAAEYPLERLEQKGVALDWRVERMRLSKDKQSLVYNEFLTLNGIPPEVYEYRLGNRSALEWVVDQYQVTIDKRSGITNDPNRADDPEYIVRLVGQVVAVSLETVKIVRELPALGLEPAQPA